MEKRKRGQIGTEYLILVGFITFAILAIVAMAFGFSNQTKDRIILNQAESFVNQLLKSSESIFFSGEPSKTTISLYLPDGVTNLTINSDNIILKVQTTSGENVKYFDSDVPLNGSISTSEGTKILVIEAKENYVLIS